MNICLMSGGHVPEAEKFVKIALLQDLWQIHCNTMMGTRKIFVFFTARHATRMHCVLCAMAQCTPVPVTSRVLSKMAEWIFGTG